MAILLKMLESPPPLPTLPSPYSEKHPLAHKNPTLHLWLALTDCSFPRREGYVVMPTCDYPMMRLLYNRKTEADAHSAPTVKPRGATNVTRGRLEEFGALLALKPGAIQGEGHEDWWAAWARVENWLRQMRPTDGQASGQAPRGWDKERDGAWEPAARLYGIVACGRKLWMGQLQELEGGTIVERNSVLVLAECLPESKCWDLGEHESEVQEFLDEIRGNH